MGKCHCLGIAADSRLVTENSDGPSGFSLGCSVASEGGLYILNRVADRRR